MHACLLDVIELLLASYRENATQQAPSHVVREFIKLNDQ